MLKINHRRFSIFVFFIPFLMLVTPLQAASLGDLFGQEELDEEERQETIERIQTIQEKIQLLQDKLQALERRKAAEEAAKKQTEIEGTIPETPLQVNWTPVDNTTIQPGDFGIYTYLLFQGDISDQAAVGVLEDFILTIETLPENKVPSRFGNRFLVPVEKPQSVVNLGRQPYDFKLNQSYLERLGINDVFAQGPILVSSPRAIDPYGSGEVPLFMAVSLGQQPANRNFELAKVWNRQARDEMRPPEQTVSELFWQIIDRAGPTQVVKNQNQIIVTLPH
jgi:hypothetical protein